MQNPYDQFCKSVKYAFSATVKILIFLLLPAGLYAQAPAITYSGSTHVLIRGTAISPLTPTNSGGAIPANPVTTVSTLAGNDSSGYVNGTGVAATFNEVRGVACDAQGNVYVADEDNQRIRKVTPAGVVTTYVGNGVYGNTDGSGGTVSLNDPKGVAVDPAGNIFVGETGNYNIRKITSSRVVSTISTKDGPHYLACDGQGNVYFQDDSIYKISPNNVLTAIYPSYGEEIAADAAGNLYFGENNLLKKLTPSKVFTTVASGLDEIDALTIDASGNLYLIDGYSVKKVTPAGVVTTLAGSDDGYAEGDGSVAKFSNPFGITVSPTGIIYIGDTGNSRVRKIVVTGYNINPALPAGLTFNSSTGTISGTPTAYSPATVYTVTAYNTSGSSTAKVTLQVEGNANLSALHLSAGSLSPAFAAATTSYTESVTNAVSSITVTAKTTDTSARMKVNGVAVVSGTASQAIALNSGANIISVVVTAASGSTKTYTITVNRAAPPNANLLTLHLSAGTLSPAFASATTAYTESVTNGVTSITVTAKTADTAARLKVNGKAVAYGAASQAIALNVGTNNINVVVTAADGTTTKDYVIKVTRSASANDNLATLHLSAGTLSPAFTSANTWYSESVTYAVTSITVTAKTGDAGATMVVDADTIASGATSQSIPLVVGFNTIAVTVYAADGLNAKTYSINVQRFDSNQAYLTQLHLSAGTLTPAFGANVFSYTANVGNSTTSITVDAAAVYHDATISINGQPARAEGASLSVPLNVGNNNISIQVTSGDGSVVRFYTVTVSRATSSNALLLGLHTSNGTLSPAFSSTDTIYTATVTNAVSSITITPKAADSTATIRINGNIIKSNTASQSIPLNVGVNTIRTIVTAQDNYTYVSYVLKVTRAAPPGDAVNEQATTVPSMDDDILLVHQAVSPNGDGLNDVLTIDGILAYPDNKLQVMDNNGKLVYSATGYDNKTKAFDGHSNITGKLQQAGTYFYSLDYRVNGQTMHKTGYIVLKY